MPPRARPALNRRVPVPRPLLLYPERCWLFSSLRTPPAQAAFRRAPCAPLPTRPRSPPRTAARKARVLDTRKQLGERDGLTAGGRRIRTAGLPVKRDVSFETTLKEDSNRRSFSVRWNPNLEGTVSKSVVLSPGDRGARGHDVEPDVRRRLDRRVLNRGIKPEPAEAAEEHRLDQLSFSNVPPLARRSRR
jgi:hypothetical protein